MTYCPICGKKLDFIDLELYYCENCNEFFIVKIDGRSGDLETIVRVPSSIVKNKSESKL